MTGAGAAAPFAAVAANVAAHVAGGAGRRQARVVRLPRRWSGVQVNQTRRSHASVVP